ncbi:MAG: glycoside hydrolase family 27 protein [Limisphaerales bacterium]
MKRQLAYLTATLAVAHGTNLFGTTTASGGFQKGESAPRPCMGWSSWSSMRRHVTAAQIEDQARVLATRLKPCGYLYVNIDSGWCNGYDTNGQIYPNHFDACGRPVPNPFEFPNGIAAVAASVHSLGLKLGIYMTPGLKIPVWEADCRILGTSNTVRQIADPSRWGSKFPHRGPQAFRGSYAIDYSKPGGQAYIQSEADLYASWGVDFLKMDWSGVRNGANPVDTRADIEHWAMALKKTGRPIWLELSGGQNVKYADFWTKYANGCRIDGDIEASPPDLTSWRHILRRFRDAPLWARYAGPGYWNDMDSLEIGNGKLDGLTPTERQTAMTLWCISCSALYTGADLTHLDPADFKLLTNREAIAIDQAGRVAMPVSQAAPQQVWRVRNADATYTVALFNLADRASKVTAHWKVLGFAGKATVRDLWSHRDLGAFKQEFSAVLEPHGSRLLTVTPMRSR